MASPFISLFTGRTGRRAVETISPQRTFADVILPAETRRALEDALAQVRNHSLIFGRWGLGERHATGLGLAFNFAGPPGTGKTICAEAIAHTLGMKLLLVNYAEVESMWMGETPKNVAALFRAAAEQRADSAKRIHQRHFVSAMEEVVAARAVMQQSIHAPEGAGRDERLIEALQAAEARWRGTALVAVALA